MKKRSARILKAFVSVLAAVAMLVLVPEAGAMKTSAAEPVTYAVKYVEGNQDWRYQVGSTFDEGKYHRELYYLRQELKEGDKVVVYNDSTSTKDLDLGQTHLNNLTVTANKAFAVIYSGDVDECYVLGGASCSVNANVKKAEVYFNAVCNFNKDVKELIVYYGGSKPEATVGCVGTVGHLRGTGMDGNGAYWNMYAFKAGTLNIQSGELKTAEWNFSRTPVQSVPDVVITAANFDYVRYANDYPDVKSAFGLDAAKLYNHYATRGKIEGRKAYAMSTAQTPTTGTISQANFDYTRYANDYPDLKAAFGLDAAKLYNHYITNGIREGRAAYAVSTAYSDFDYVRYANDYPDLKAAFGYNAEALFNHYVTRGAIERRVAYNTSGTVR